MHYRLAKLDDLPQLASLRWSQWLEDGEDPALQQRDQFVEQFSAWMAPKLDSSWYLWCAFAQQTLVANIYIQRIEKLPKPSAPATDAFGYVTGVYTRAEHRNQGIGAALMGQVGAWALETNLEFLVLWPSTASVPFWTRAGFSANESLLHRVRAYIN